MKKLLAVLCAVLLAGCAYKAGLSANNLDVVKKKSGKEIPIQKGAIPNPAINNTPSPQDTSSKMLRPLSTFR